MSRIYDKLFRSTLINSSEDVLRDQTFTLEERIPGDSNEKFFVGKIDGVVVTGDDTSYSGCLTELLEGIPDKESLPLRIKFAMELRGLA